MKFWSTLATVLVLPAVLARPITPVAITSNAQILTTRGALDKAINTARAQGSGGSKQKAVTGAANSFAGDVAIVSRSLNSIGTTTDPSTTRSLARDAFVAEKDEDQHRAVLDSAAGGDADRANQKIVDNTPIVLKGLQSIMSDPGMDNTMRNLAKIESARNANILPSITQLTNSAFKQTGVNQQAKQFASTTGTTSLRKLQASGADS